MRRRALLAASQTGGGNTGGFKADFYFDYCEEFFMITTCYRNADELGLACFNEVFRLIEEYGIQTTTTIRELKNPINYGFEVYIEGSIVTAIRKEDSMYIMDTEGSYPFVRIVYDGTLIYEG